MLITCPRCYRNLDEISFRDIFDNQTGTLERFISCIYCGYEEFDEVYGKGFCESFPPESCCPPVKCAMFTPVGGNESGEDNWIGVCE